MTYAYCPFETEAERETPASRPAAVAAGEEAPAEVAEPELTTSLGFVAHAEYVARWRPAPGSFPSDEDWEAVAQAVALAYLEQLREGLAGL
jgi:hypothetical protein